ncbi:uncharacterized protein [Miscanthus floridulus]|uniref:uncharacterized protein isoform X2 n=1 Tax=Miscanthus floridulus TaxID=154761 RepID=UPI003459CDA9
MKQHGAVAPPYPPPDDGRDSVSRPWWYPLPWNAPQRIHPPASMGRIPSSCVFYRFLSICVRQCAGCKMDLQYSFNMKAFAGHSSTAGLFCLLRPSCRSDGLATMNICIKQSCSHLFRKTSLSVRRLILLPPPALH